MMLLVFAMLPASCGIDAEVAVDAAMISTLPSSCSGSCLTVDISGLLLPVAGPGAFRSLVAELLAGTPAGSILSPLLAVLRWFALLRRRRLVESLPDSEPDLEKPAGRDELVPIWNVVA